MNIRLIDKPSNDIPPMVQVCLNRGIPIDDIKEYLAGGESHINAPTAFDESLLKAGARTLVEAIQTESNIFIVVDSDCDGFTASAILINYLYALFPAWTTEHVKWAFHEGKSHGLSDMMENIYNTMLPWDKHSLVICPDSASNDISQIEELYGNNIEVLILDHHITEEFSKYAITINSQYDYPNKELSGAGVVYQFCCYLDDLLGQNHADDYLDLVAVGLQGDMMDLRSLETKELIFKGLQEEHIKNPLIYGLTQKNAFALGKADYAPSNRNGLFVTPMGCSFFIVPLINAICRSGTMEEKALCFDAMLTMKAFNMIPSNKRGHKQSEMERVVDQALRTLTNVKNRQTRAEEAGLALLENQIPAMIDNKVFVFSVGEEVDPNIRGLVANKIMAKYQRPVCVVSKLSDGTYAGSMRGFTKTGIESFKEVAETSPACIWVRGHDNAAGLCITDPEQFMRDMNAQLANISTEILYYVDYIFNAANINPNIVLSLADANDYLGTGFDRPQIYVEEIELDSLTIMKGNTIKLSTVSGTEIMKFGATDEEVEKLSMFKGTMNAVCKPVKNEWCGNVKPQLMIIDYELVKSEPGIMAAWGF